MAEKKEKIFKWIENFKSILYIICASRKLEEKTKKWKCIQAYFTLKSHVCKHMCVYTYIDMCVYVYLYLSSTYISVKNQCSKIPVQEVRKSTASYVK